MSCFGACTSPDIYQNCCNANTLCEFDGTLDNVVSEPIFVQKVFDAVLFNLQGLKTVANQCFSPAIPRGHRLKRVIDIRCNRYFNPENVEDPANLKLNINTTISGASFIQHSNGEEVTVVGPDGTYSERVIYADTRSCDEQGKGTPIFGTQNISITGDVQVALDLLLCDRYDHEVVFTVCANVNIAQESNPLFLTNFFELCMPSTQHSAFMPRFAEFCNPMCETRLATNNMGRDLTLCPDGTVKANLIIALCITCEKKIIVPVQLCVLSTGYVQLSPQASAICTNFPQLFPDQLQEDEKEEEAEEDECCECKCVCETVPCEPECPPSPKPKNRR
ncbi:MAG: hypothetical protein SOY83_03075 [Anaerovoracaceae bacterium]|nr:hypothetical protein [Bacillota bacterium]MDY3954449.1 hypothetical protein [Anaerovoracaceae bacterium]